MTRTDERREPMAELPPSAVTVDDGFWSPRLEMNRTLAIHYQWEHLEESGCLDNFRIVAGELEGERRGFFYADSDAYKWLEAACLVLRDERRGPDGPDGSGGPDEALAGRVAELVRVLRAAQAEDGYLYTFGQAHFPGQRWRNLQIEHELYSLGHLIEAGLAHHEATRSDELLEVATRAADLMVRDLAEAGPSAAPGHEEVEIALVRLSRRTGRSEYLELARSFVERRGRTSLFGLRFLGQSISHLRRAATVRKRQAASPGGAAGYDLTENLTTREPRFLKLRTLTNILSGKYNQQHAPLDRMEALEGHAVRAVYLMTAAALVEQERPSSERRAHLAALWERMVTRRMYVTGGIGSMPLVEGFTRDHDLDNVFAYCETCAALGSIFWSWEMLRSTADARYAALIEWQLYNAALVGIALDGRSYLYRNPLETNGELQRRAWFDTPCCPSNVSRTWAGLRKYAYGFSGGRLFVHQHLGGHVDLDDASRGAARGELVVRSQLPYEGHVELRARVGPGPPLQLELRVPAWSGPPRLTLDGVELPVTPEPAPAAPRDPQDTWAVPLVSRYLTIEIPADGGDHLLDATFPMEVHLHQPHPAVRGNRGRVAISRGPLVYCLEDIDNPGAGVPDATLDPSAGLHVEPSPLFAADGRLLLGADPAGRPLTFVPYHAWANREPSSMQVWVRTP